MMIVSAWRSEKSHDAVALFSAQRPAKALYRRPHRLDRGIELVERVFRVEVFDDRGRFDDICKQD